MPEPLPSTGGFLGFKSIIRGADRMILLRSMHVGQTTFHNILLVKVIAQE
jgi:hypothetical protein